jgi:pyruvate formate lyase activating enzyme
MSKDVKAEIMGINRMRMGTDGKGISTLVTFYGCNLNCKYCLNPQCKNEKTRRTNITPDHLVEILSVDDIYFQSTGGGVVFGGGEPLLQSEYIKEVCKKMPDKWQRRIETSLSVSWDKVDLLIPYIDEWIVDIKESHQGIYKDYTGVDGCFIVYENVCKLSEKIGKEKIVIRIPEIPDYNTEDNVLTSMEMYADLGKIDVFKYRKMNVSPR